MATNDLRKQYYTALSTTINRLRKNLRQNMIDSQLLPDNKNYKESEPIKLKINKAA